VDDEDEGKLGIEVGAPNRRLEVVGADRSDPFRTGGGRGTACILGGEEVDVGFDSGCRFGNRSFGAIDSSS
jgi:hypothetical protein